MSLFLVLVLGLLLVMYSRSHNQAAADRTSPYWDRNGGGSGDHIHNAFGAYVCDHWASALTDTRADLLGIHTHGDGLIHIHPFAPAVSGRSAIMKAWADQVGMSVSKTTIAFPGQATLKNGDTCPPSADGKLKGGKGELQVWIWQTPDQKTPDRYTGDPNKIHFDPDRVIAFAFVVPGTAVPEPPSFAKLAAPNDTEPGKPTAGTTTPGGASTTTTPGGVTTTTAAGGSTTTTVATGTTAPNSGSTPVTTIPVVTTIPAASTSS